MVSEGIYEDINYNGKNIVITGENNETTIIDGGGQCGYFCKWNKLTILENLTIQNGATNGDGGGINCMYAQL